MTNPWHDIELFSETKFDEVPVVIEVPRGSKVKYEICKKTGMILVDRILSGPLHYPANYGLIPRTYCDDNDPLDILVIGQSEFVPLSLLRARPVGVLEMIDQDEIDDKIIAVHLDDPQYKHIKSIKELSEHQLKELKQFFEDYKKLENKKVEVKMFHDEHRAYEIVENAIKLYKKEFK